MCENLFKVFLERYHHVVWLLLGMLVAAIMWPQPLLAWQSTPSAEGEVRNYVEAVKSHKAALFIAECNVTDDIKGVVVFQVGRNVGNFFAIADRTREGSATAVMSAQIMLKRGDAVAEWTLGKGAAGADDEHLVRFLMSGLFRFLPAANADEIYTRPARQSCLAEWP